MITNILNVTRGLICQQVNCQGVMGAGLAKAIRNKWPKVYTSYRVNYMKAKLGQIQPICVDNNLYVINFFAQDRYGRDKQHTDYTAFTTCLIKLSQWQRKNCPKLPVYIPYKIGCGLAGGDWSIVKELIKTIIPTAIIVNPYNQP